MDRIDELLKSFKQLKEQLSKDGNEAVTEELVKTMDALRRQMKTNTDKKAAQKKKAGELSQAKAKIIKDGGTLLEDVPSTGFKSNTKAPAPKPSGIPLPDHKPDRKGLSVVKAELMKSMDDLRDQMKQNASKKKRQKEEADSTAQDNANRIKDGKNLRRHPDTGFKPNSTKNLDTGSAENAGTRSTDQGHQSHVSEIVNNAKQSANLTDNKHLKAAHERIGSGRWKTIVSHAVKETAKSKATGEKPASTALHVSLTAPHLNGDQQKALAQHVDNHVANNPARPDQSGITTKGAGAQEKPKVDRKGLSVIKAEDMDKAEYEKDMSVKGKRGVREERRIDVATSKTPKLATRLKTFKEKNTLVKALEEAGFRQSALLLSNWDEMDAAAETMAKSMDKTDMCAKCGMPKDKCKCSDVAKDEELAKPGMNAAGVSSLKNAFGGGGSAPAPEPAAADSGNSLGSMISSGLSSLRGK